jgi:uncharacterized protein with GYD domain
MLSCELISYPSIRSIFFPVIGSPSAAKAGTGVGIKLKEIVWTQGQYDLVAISEAPDEATATAFLLNMLKAGNLRAQTLRAFTAAEMEKILEKIA